MDDLTIGKIEEYFELTRIDLIEGGFDEISIENVLKLLFLLRENKNLSFDAFLASIRGQEEERIRELISKVKSSFDVKLVDRKGGKNKEAVKAKRFSLIDVKELAGSCCCSNYKEFLLKDLFAYADGYNKGEWARLSVLLALVNNCHAFKQKDVKTPDAFNPFLKNNKKDETRVSGDFFTLLANKEEAI